jgi:carbamate kinase
MTTPRRVVVVLGGNAFAPPGAPLTMAGQFRFAHEALSKLGALLDRDVELVVGHGNGPQVGHMLVRVEEALGKAYALSLEVCVAESEGELGYVLAQTLGNLCRERGAPRPIASLLTQVEVAPSDPAFGRPDKPVGPFYEAAQAEALREKGFVLREDAGRGYRRVVPSPEPRAIVDVEVIEQLLSTGAIVIAAGGGGIPVTRREDGTLHGLDAVIDKDLTAALLANEIHAELLVILTAIDAAYVDHQTPRARPIRRASPEQVRALAAEGHFAPGSMGPKMEAAARFASAPGRRCVICDPGSLADALEGRAGTTVVRDEGVRPSTEHER